MECGLGLEASTMSAGSRDSHDIYQDSRWRSWRGRARPVPQTPKTTKKTRDDVLEWSKLVSKVRGCTSYCWNAQTASAVDFDSDCIVRQVAGSRTRIDRRRWSWTD
jgi:hypothetical protein